MSQSMKRSGFTLSEVLLALLIVGIIAILILPSMNKTIKAKSQAALLKNTVASISAAVQTEIQSKRTEEITLTDIYKQPGVFLKRFDTTSSNEPFAASYKNLSGADVSDISIPAEDNKVQLKNGVSIGIINKLFGKDSTGIVIDLNGRQKPNVVGVDYFILQVLWKDSDEEDGLHAGDLSAYKNGGADGTETCAALKTSCESGNGAACYRMVELTGFNEEYLTNCKEEEITEGE